ncbi:MAG: aminopeptidase P family protein [Desulfobulbaceae bacterium]|nr:aminopeptidase P family protein [Desulfobulbaceae bacterium]
MRDSQSTIPLTELQVRLTKLQKALAAKEMDGALIVQKTDLFYFSGTSQQGWLYVPVEGKPLLMIFKDYDRACADSPLSDVISVVSNKKIPEYLVNYGYPRPASLGMELDVLPANLYFQYRSIFKEAQIGDISTEIRLVRAVKSPYEIGKIKLAARFSDQLAARVPELLRAGKTEVELAGELEGYARSLGHQGIVRMRMWGSELFYGHLLSGSDAAVPSYLASPTGGQGVSSIIGQGAGFKKIQANEPVLVDYVFALDGYLSDHARIFAIGGLSDDLLDAHQAMLEIQEEVKVKAKPGVLTGELYDFMVSLAISKGYDEQFMGVGDRRIRFTGHGVGLELDEFPFIAKGQRLPLEEGMVIALEPKTIFPGQGVVGIENTHLVTENGLQALTKFPDQVAIVSV